MDVLKKQSVAYSIAIGVVLFSTFFMWENPEEASAVDEPVVVEDTGEPHEPKVVEIPEQLETIDDVINENRVYNLGDTFQFEDRNGLIELTFSEDLSFTTGSVFHRGDSTREDTDIIVIPVAMTNIEDTSETVGLSSNSQRSFGPNGTRLGGANYNSHAFRETDIRNLNNRVRSGSTFHGNLHIMYDGNGEYVIELGDNLSEMMVTVSPKVHATIVFTLEREEVNYRQGVELLALGDTFILDDLVITIEDDIRFTEITRSSSSHYGLPVVYLPITVTNNGNSVNMLSTLSNANYSPDGVRGPCICSDFPDTNVFREQDIQPGETRNSFIHLIYTQDGEYTMDFGHNITSSRNPGEVEVRFVFDVVK